MFCHAELVSASSTFMIKKIYYVYILTNFTNSVLYVGMSGIGEGRIISHKLEVGRF